ncbi:MAG: hypothetical protein K2N63_10150 [Lachnospiraceae bacterium]|nr:hypothetical protein [Lachnospiraceae bacterium]
MEENTQAEDRLDLYLINETTSIKSDFYHLGIELSRKKYKNLQDIHRSDLISMICLESSLYVYWAMPEDTDYQVNYIIINGKKYENGMRVLDINGNYRKYVFPDFEQTSDGQYQITEVGFKKPEGEKIKYTTLINCKMGSSNNQFTFEQKSENKIVLVGMLLESIYQFDNEKGSLRDAWNNYWNNIERKDGDQRSFYYFAFNCFDREIDHYFTPDKITLITIDYTINQYTFLGNKSDYKEAKLTKTEQKIQTVTPETIHVEAKNEINSNDHPYEYNTIYKLSEADIKDYEKSANYNTLYTAQQAGFEWVVHFGDTSGYRYAENFTKSNCDIDYTKVENFSTINITYTYKGEEYSVPTDTLVDMEVLTKREKDNTESLIKQISDSIKFSVESLGNMLANTVISTASLPLHFLRGILKNPVVRTVVIVIGVFLVLGIIIKVVL